MSVLHRNRTEPAAVPQPQLESQPEPSSEPSRPLERPTAAGRPAAHTRVSAAWFGVCFAAVVLTVLIIFLLQNTGSTEVSFLWLHGSLPLATALLIAAVGSSLLTMSVAATRIVQLRRRLREYS